MRGMMLSLALLAAACAGGPAAVTEVAPDNPFVASRGTAPAPPSTAAAQGAAPPEGIGPGGIDFGAWRSADPATYGPAFQAAMQARYRGQDRAAARADLERNGFSCSDAGGVLQCRIEIMAQSCARDWYVAFEPGTAPPRAGFDVMCLGAAS